MAFVGRRGEINAAPGEPVLDLEGRAVLPGLVDGHAHLMHLARARLSLDASGLGSEAAVAERSPPSRAPPPGRVALRPRLGSEPLAGEGLPVARLARPRGAAPPGGAHAHRRPRTWANSAALAAAGITRQTADPDGGIVARDRDGEPTGLLDRHRAAARARRAAAAVGGALRPRGGRRRSTSAWPRGSPGSTRWARTASRSPRTGAWSRAGASRSATTPRSRRGRRRRGTSAASAGPSRRRRRPGRGRRGEALAGRGARLAGRRAALAVLRRPRQHRAPAGPPDELARVDRGGGAADSRSACTRSATAPTRSRSTRSSARSAGLAPGAATTARGSSTRRSSPRRRRALPRPRRAAEHAGHALHLGHGVGGGAARAGSAALRLRVALAAGTGVADRGRLGLPGGGRQPVSRAPRVGDAPAARARTAAGSPTSG